MNANPPTSFPPSHTWMQLPFKISVCSIYELFHKYNTYVIYYFILHYIISYYINYITLYQYYIILYYIILYYIILYCIVLYCIYIYNIIYIHIYMPYACPFSLTFPWLPVAPTASRSRGTKEVAGTCWGGSRCQRRAEGLGGLRFLGFMVIIWSI